MRINSSDEWLASHTVIGGSYTASATFSAMVLASAHNGGRAKLSCAKVSVSGACHRMGAAVGLELISLYSSRPCPLGIQRLTLVMVPSVLRNDCVLWHRNQKGETTCLLCGVSTCENSAIRCTLLNATRPNCKRRYLAHATLFISRVPPRAAAQVLAPLGSALCPRSFSRPAAALHSSSTAVALSLPRVELTRTAAASWVFATEPVLDALPTSFPPFGALAERKGLHHLCRQDGHFA